MGTPWLRPWVFRRILRASKHSSKAAARACPSPLPAVLRKCYETSSIWFVLFAVALSRTRQSKSSISARMEHWNMEKTAGARGGGGGGGGGGGVVVGGPRRGSRAGGGRAGLHGAQPQAPPAQLGMRRRGWEGIQRAAPLRAGRRRARSPIFPPRRTGGGRRGTASGAFPPRPRLPWAGVPCAAGVVRGTMMGLS